MDDAPLAIVTGSTRGIGRALCEGLLASGWRVLGLARGEAVPELAAHPDHHHLRADLGDAAALAGPLPEALVAMLAELGATARRELLLVHNAAVLGPVGPLAGDDPAVLEHCLRVGLVAPMLLTGTVLRATPDVPLRVVFVSSGAAERPIAGWSAYCSTKAGLRMAARCLAQDVADDPQLATRDVRVLSWSPGVVDTAMQAQIRATDPALFPPHARFVELHASGSLATPEASAADLLRRLESPFPEGFHEARYSG